MAKKTSKRSSKKKVAKKTSTAAKKKTTRKKAAKKKTASKATVTAEQRYNMITEAAYFIAEKHGFMGDSVQFWLMAEAEVDAKLKK